jgi:hypothetical protein
MRRPYPLSASISSSDTNLSSILLHKKRSANLFAALPIRCSCSGSLDRASGRRTSASVSAGRTTSPHRFVFTTVADRSPVHELGAVNGHSLRFKCRATPAGPSLSGSPPGYSSSSASYQLLPQQGVQLETLPVTIQHPRAVPLSSWRRERTGLAFYGNQGVVRSDIDPDWLSAAR